MRKSVLKNCMQALAVVVFMLAVWGLAYMIAGNELLVPAFSDCVKEVGRLVASASFWKSVGGTVIRTFGAFFASFILAVGLALTAYLIPAVRGFFGCVVSAMRSLPTLAVLLILLLWWGAGFAPVAVAFLSLFPMLYTCVFTAFLGVDGELIEMSKAYGVPVKRQVAQLYLPAVAPCVIREGSGAAAFALKLVISAEVLADTVKSLGGMMQEAKAYLDVPLLFALVIVSLILGLLIEGLGIWLAKTVERRVK